MPSHPGSRAWHMEQRPSTVSRTLEKSGDATTASTAVEALASPPSERTLGTVESHMMAMNRSTVASHVQVGLPLLAWRVLNQ